MGIGAMFPFCRGHTETDTLDHEPWSFGEEVCPLLIVVMLSFSVFIFLYLLSDSMCLTQVAAW